MEPSDVRPGRAPALLIAALAVLTAVTTVFTILVRIPIPATGGYWHFGDAAIYFASFALGPLTAAIAGGLGTALADVIGGYASWAPLSLIAHGVQGLTAGLIAGAAAKAATARDRPSALRWTLGGLAGLVVMVGLYLLGGLLMVGPAALSEVPWNLVQGAVGAVIGASLALVVRRAYPPVRDLSW